MSETTTGRPIPDIERRMVQAIMAGDREDLRVSIGILMSMDRALEDGLREVELIRKGIEAGAHPSATAVRSAIRARSPERLNALLEGRGTNNVEALGACCETLRSITPTPNVHENAEMECLPLLLDNGMVPCVELASAAAAGRRSRVLALLRERGLTEQELIEGVCGRG